MRSSVTVYSGFCVAVTIYNLYLVISFINLISVIYLIDSCCTLAFLCFFKILLPAIR